MKISILLLSILAVLAVAHDNKHSHPNGDKSGVAPIGKYQGSALMTTMEVVFDKNTFSFTLKGLVNHSVSNIKYTMKNEIVQADQKNEGLHKFIASFKIPSLTVASFKLSYSRNGNHVEAAILGFKFHARKI